MGDAKGDMQRPVTRVLRGLIDVIALLVVVALFAFVLTPGEVDGNLSDDTASEGAVPSARESEYDIAPGGVREHILEHGTAETGAFNLVTAIYLGYRAFDTLGETIVLLLAVSGVAYLVGAKR